MDGDQLPPQQTCAMLIVLCRTAWLPPRKQRAFSGDAEDYAVCLVQPSSEGATAEDHNATTWGFPAGQIDPADSALAKFAAPAASDHVPLALRITAIRRTFESTGMCIAIGPPPGFAREHVREILHRKGPPSFADFIGDFHGFGPVQPYALGEEFSRITLRRSVDAPGPEWHVFLAHVPEAQEAALASPGHDGTQLTWWVTPTEALSLHAKKDLDLSLLTWHVLRELRHHMKLVDDLGRFRKGEVDLMRTMCLELYQGGRSQQPSEGRASVVFPGDELHSGHPGPAGARRRATIDTDNGDSVLALEEQEVVGCSSGDRSIATNLPKPRL